MEDALTWIAIIGFVISIFSAIYPIYTRHSDRKVYNFVFSYVKKNIDKALTDEEINQSKNILEDLKNKINQATIELPKEARKIVLKDRINNLQLSLIKDVENLKELDKSLKNLEKETSIDSKLLKEIEDVIQPNYIIKEKKQKLLNLLTLFTTISTILLTLPIPKYFGMLFALFALFTILRMSIYFLKPLYNKHELLILRIVMFIFGVLIAFSLSLSIILFIFYFIDKFDIFFILFGSFFLILGISFSITLKKLYDKYKTIKLYKSIKPEV